MNLVASLVDRLCVRLQAGRGKRHIRRNMAKQSLCARCSPSIEKMPKERRGWLVRALGTTHKRLQTQEQLQKHDSRRGASYNHLDFSTHRKTSRQTIVHSQTHEGLQRQPYHTGSAVLSLNDLFGNVSLVHLPLRFSSRVTVKRQRRETVCIKHTSFLPTCCLAAQTCSIPLFSVPWSSHDCCVTHSHNQHTHSVRLRHQRRGT